MDLIKCIKMKQWQLFHELKNKFKGAYYVHRQYILVPGDAPIMLVAHLDTVHREPVKDICFSDDKNIMMSPQGIGGDDRCGVYALVKVHREAEVKPWLLFTCDEEIGGVGASAFCDDYSLGKIPYDLSVLKALIEIDRKGSDDAVFYDCDNVDFERYINSKGFFTSFGSFSDISCIAPEIGVAAVNLSSGYYDAHMQHEHIVVSELENTIRKVLDIVGESVDPSFPHYEYVEAKYTYNVTKYSQYYGSSLKKKSEFSWEQYYDDVAASVPKEIQKEYRALLDFYTVTELEEIREEYGDSFILSLCRSELGDDYYTKFESVDVE